jgi:hypothetical protein
MMIKGEALSPHLFGIIGESLNFFGAVALAFDILLRSPERTRRKRLGELHDFATRTGLRRVEYQGFTVASSDFADNILDRRAARFGYTGVTLLGLGFLLLVVYHVMEMRT